MNDTGEQARAARSGGTMTVRSIRHVSQLLSNFGVVVRRWETPTGNIDWTVIKPRSITPQTVSETELRAIRKMKQSAELIAIASEYNTEKL